MMNDPQLTRLFANKLRALSIFAWISRGTGR